MAFFKAAPSPIYVCANIKNFSHSHPQSQLGFQDSCLGFNQKNSCSGFHFNLSFNSPKWECLAVVRQKDVIPIEDDKPLSTTDYVVDQAQNTPPKPIHRDLTTLPKPLSARGLESSPSDGSKVRVAHKGSPGSFNEAAALRAYPKCEPVPCDQFEDVLKAVDLWMVDKAVLPVENSVGGSIHRNYDMLLRYRLHIVGEIKLVVNHCLLALPGVKKEELRKVLSHTQAIDQCKRMLNNIGVAGISAKDTGTAAKIVACEGLRAWGAIASPRAAQIYGLNIIEERIQDDLDNVTRFLVLSREPIIPGTDRPYKTSIVFTLEEGPGVLFKALAVFALRDIVLTKIESRPEKKRPLRVVDDGNGVAARYFDYTFYIDFEASMAEPRAQNALRHLQEVTKFLRVLGCYPVDSD